MLDRTFASLADPTRRAIVERLTREGEVHVGALASAFTASLPAVIKHIDVLEDAGLVRRQRKGRFVCCSLKPDAMEEARRWLDRNLRFWAASFDRLEDLLDKKEDLR